MAALLITTILPPLQVWNLGATHTTAVEYDVDCQGLDDASEIYCVPNAKHYQKYLAHIYHTQFL